MCVTMYPAWLASTVLYAAEVDAGGERVHVLGYQNKVANKTSPLARLVGRGGGNAMILPFPAEPGTMTRDNVLDTEDCPNILQDIKRTIEPPPRGHGGGASQGRAAAVQVFTTGIYTVVLARDARAIPRALSRVPAEKRPGLNPQLFDAYAIWYPDWTIALCCFNNRQAALATPMLWWYRPRDPERLFAPALDCHTGAVPDLHAKVTVDHVVAFASPDLGEQGQPVHYHDAIPPAVAPYLCERVIGGSFHKRMPNGDFVCRVADVRRGLFKPQRALPPAA